MNERFEHRKPIIGRDCERDGFFNINHFTKTIFLEDGFVSQVRLDKKCKGCCAESPRTKWVWHGEDCLDPSQLTMHESVRFEDGVINPFDSNFNSAFKVDRIEFGCDSCHATKFKETKELRRRIGGHPE